MKDFYDLYTILCKNTMDPTLLEKAIHATLKNRRTIYEENHPLFNDDFPINPRFQMLWKSFMKKIRKAKPDFETVVRLIKEKLFPIGRSIRSNRMQLCRDIILSSPLKFSY